MKAYRAKNQLTATAAILIGLLASEASGANPAHAAPEKAWNIKATSSYCGSLNAQFRENAIRFSLDKFGLTLVSHAPKWDIYWYNESSKKYVTYPASEANDRFKALLGGHRLVGKGKTESVHTGKTKTVAGMKTEETRLSVEQERGTRHVDLWTTSKVLPPPQFMQLLRTILDVPASEKGLPLLVTNDTVHGEQVRLFEVMKIMNQTTPAENFDMPKGLKKVQDLMQLLISEDEMGGDEDDDDKSFDRPAKPVEKTLPAPAKSPPSNSGFDLKNFLSPGKK